MPDFTAEALKAKANSAVLFLQCLTTYLIQELMSLKINWKKIVSSIYSSDIVSCSKVNKRTIDNYIFLFV